MKNGKSLVQLAQELERQSESKLDYVTSTETMELTTEGNLLFGDSQELRFPLTNNAHSQIAKNVDIPSKYYNKMRQVNPELLATNVNAWFNYKPDRRMIRTLDHKVRAFLSPRYRRLDNSDLAKSVLPILAELGSGMKIISCELTETRMYIKAINQNVELEVREGDVVQAGVSICNSEIGRGSLCIEPLIYRLVCKNGMIANDFSTKKYHVGRSAEQNAFELFRDETIKADDRAFFLKVQDTVKAAVELVQFSQIVDQLKEATKKPIEKSPIKTVEVLANDFHYSKEESNGILTHLIRGGDLTSYGLSNAITRTSQDLDDYDRATELERDGSKILRLSPSSWKKLALAE